MKSSLLVCFLFGVALAEYQSSICETVENNTFVDNPVLCGAYIYCHNGVAYPGICPGSSVFNSSTLKCEVDGNSCQDAFKVPIPMDNVGKADVLFLTNPDCCGCYFYCEGTLQSNTCPAGYHFSFDQQLCDYPDNVNCPYPSSV